jgi:DNA-binding winged helix-turn-helix (wHTH) protein
MSDRPILRFGAFELDASSGELRRSGDPIKLPPQPFKVLELLARRSGEVVTREEIRAHVWCDDTVVDFEQGLNFCVRRIREVLGDTADAPRFIETLPRRGYRFLMAVTGPEPTRAARVTRLIVLPFRPLRPDPEDRLPRVRPARRAHGGAWRTPVAGRALECGRGPFRRRCH